LRDVFPNKIVLFV